MFRSTYIAWSKFVNSQGKSKGVIFPITISQNSERTPSFGHISLLERKMISLSVKICLVKSHSDVSFSLSKTFVTYGTLSSFVKH